MDIEAHHIDDIRVQMRKARALAEGAIEQVSDEDLFRQLDPESNSIAILMRHVAGNLKSRFTDFLTSDGEKPDRHRDGEFEVAGGMTRKTVRAEWDLGFSRLESALDALTPADLAREVQIRGERLTVMQALHRAFGHVSMHVGQIVMLAKHLRGANWRTLSIPRGQSEAYSRRKS